MYSIDVLKQNMIELGAKRSQVESNVVELVLLALSGEEELKEIKKDLRLRDEAREIKHSAEIDRVVARDYANNAKRDLEEKKETERKTEEMINAFRNEIKLMETEEARDRVRLAEYFFDKTEGERRPDVIKGLSYILSVNRGAKNE